MPIRWDNVNAPDLSSSGRMLEASGQHIGNALASLKSMLGATDQVTQANWDNQRTNSTNDALAKIMGYSNSKALGDAQRGGLYHQLIGDGSVPIDQKAVMAALDSRGPLLQQREVAGMNYENAVTDYGQQDTRRTGMLAMLKGDTVGVEQALSGMRDPTSMVNVEIARRNQAAQLAMQQSRLDSEAKLQPLKEDLLRAQVKNYISMAEDPDRTTVGGAGGKGGSGKAGVNNKAELSDGAATDYLTAKLDKEGNPYMSPYSLEKFAKYAKDFIPNEGVRTGILAGVSKLDRRGFSEDGKTFIPYPQGVLEQAGLEIAENPNWYYNPLSKSWPDQFVAKADEIMKRQGTRERMQEADDIQKALAADPVARQELARKLGMRAVESAGSPVSSISSSETQANSVATFANNARIRDFATGGYRDPATNQTPVVPVQTAPAGLTYNQLMGGTDPKKEMSANPPTSTPLISKEDKLSASVGLSLGTSGSITDVHPDAIKIPEVDWSKPKVIQQAAPGAIPKGGGERAVVTYVEDGDTAKLLRGNGSQINCRIDKIDAPETAKANSKPGQPFGDQAKKTLQDMIDNKEVTLRITRPEDKWGRAGCQIEVEGSNVDLSMVQAGAAWLYRRYANDPNLVKAEQEAKMAKRGLWADPNPVNPEVFRRSLEKAREGR